MCLCGGEDVGCVEEKMWFQLNLRISKADQKGVYFFPTFTLKFGNFFYIITVKSNNKYL